MNLSFQIELRFDCRNYVCVDVDLKYSCRSYDDSNYAGETIVQYSV